MSPDTLDLPGPLVFFLFCLLAAVVCYLVNRLALLSGLIAAASCFAMAWIGLRLASGEPLSLLGQIRVLDRPLVVLGREWALTSSSLALLTFIHAACGLAFLLSLPGSQGWSFYPFGMGVMAALVLSATAQQTIYAILFLWLASVVAVFVLSGGRPGATTGSVRSLVLTSVAAMSLLTVLSYLGPEADPGLLHTATILLVLGFGILLMLVPFHGQLVAIAAHTAPMVPAFVLSTFSPAVFYLLLTIGSSYPALLQDGLLFDVCRWLGTAAVAIGGVAAAGQRKWGYLVGYATLVDWGAGLIALGQGTHLGVEWAIQMLIWRSFSLILAGTGLTIVFKAAGKKDDMAACGGLLQRQLLGVLALIGGLFSLAGFPLTPGATGRWPLIGSLLVSQPETAWVMILAGAGVCTGTLTGLRACLGPIPKDVGGDRFETVIGMGFALLAMWLVGVLSVNPTPWLELARRIVESLSFLPV